MLSHNQFAYKKTKNDCKVEDRYQKSDQFSVAFTQNRSKKTAYNEGRLYLFVISSIKKTKQKNVKTMFLELQAIVDGLKCGSDVADCLLDTAAEDLSRVVPYEWQDTRQLDLPQVRGH